MQLLNQSEAARLLRLSTRTMERMRLQGIGPSYIKCGRSVRYRLDLIEEWVSRRVVSSTSEQVNDRVYDRMRS
jgi:hypothetical protein